MILKSICVTHKATILYLGEVDDSIEHSQIIIIVVYKYDNPNFKKIFSRMDVKINSLIPTVVGFLP